MENNASVIGRLAFLASIVGDQAVAGMQNMAKGTGAAMTKLASAVPAAAFAASAAALAGMGAAMAGSVVAAAQFEDSFALVRKVLARASEEELSDIRDSILDLSTTIPVTADSLAQLASIAGQLGVGVSDIPQFVDTVAKLGVATNMTAEQAAFSIARLANVTGIGAENADVLGNVLVRLGNNTAATESEIVLLATRFGAVGKIAGLTADEVLAFSASVRATGTEAQAGATALQKLFLAMQQSAAQGGAKLNAFAEAAGMTGENFRKLAQEDISAAALAFVQGLDSIGKSGGDVQAVLNDVGLGSVRVSKVLLSLSSDTEELASNLSLANDEMSKQSALNNEAEKRFGTLLNQLQRLRNGFKAVMIDIGEGLVPVLAKLTGNLADAISGFREFNDVLNTDSFVKATKALAAFTALGIIPLLRRIPAVTKLIYEMRVASIALAEGMTFAKAASMGLMTALKPFLIAGAVIGGFTLLANKVAKTAEELAIAKRNLEDFRDVMNKVSYSNFAEDINDEIARGLFNELEEQTQNELVKAFGPRTRKVLQDILKNTSEDVTKNIASTLTSVEGILPSLMSEDGMQTTEDSLRKQLALMEENLIVVKEQFGAESEIAKTIQSIISNTNRRIRQGRALNETESAALYRDLERLDVFNELLELQSISLKQKNDEIDAILRQELLSAQYSGNIRAILNDEEDRMSLIKQFLPYNEELRALVGDIADDTEDAAESMGVFADLIADANDFAAALDDSLKPLEAFQDLEEARDDLRDAKEELINLDKEEVELNEDLIRIRQEIQDLQKSGKYLLEDQLDIQEELLELDEMRKAVNGELELSAKEQLKIKQLEREKARLERAKGFGGVRDVDLQIEAIQEQIDAIKSRGVTSEEVTEKEKEIAKMRDDAAKRAQEDIIELKEEEELIAERLLEIDDDRADAAKEVVDAQIEIAKKTGEAIIAFAQLDKAGVENMTSLARALGVPESILKSINSEINTAKTNLAMLPALRQFNPIYTSDFGRLLEANKVQLSRRAGGGMVRMGNSAIVGEGGMELIKPNPSGVMVKPLGPQNSGGGGNVVNLNITGLPTDPIAARKIAQNIQRELNKLKGDGRSGIVR